MNTDFITARRSGIGGSDIGAILGVSPYKTALDIYLSKTTEQPEKQGDWLYWGHALETPIIARFENDHGVKVQHAPPLFRHSEYDWALANVDGLILDENGHPTAILEIKTASAFKSGEWGEESTDEVPLTYIAQVQWYMWICGLQTAYIAVLIGGQIYRDYRIDRDQELIDLMIEKAKDFWENHVLKGIPPEPQNGAQVQTLYPQDNGEAIEADTDALTAFNELKTLKAQADELKAQIAEKEDTIKLKIGNAAMLTLNGAPLATWKTQTSRRFDSIAFKAAQPELYKQFQKESETRVLRLK